MTNVPWPADLKPSDFGYSYQSFDVSGGMTLAGNEQFVASPGPRWGASMVVPIRSYAHVLSVRTLRSQLQGRTNPVLLPNFDQVRVSWPVEAATGRILTPRVARRIDGTYALDNTSYAGPAIPTTAQIVAKVHPAALVRATQLTIRVSKGGPVLAGQQFGITSGGGANRLYEIASVDTTTVVGADTDYTITFKPPLRAAAADNATVSFTQPVCLMRCMNLDEQTRMFSGLRFATLSLEFMEYF
jgi:hypothetical protein